MSTSQIAANEQIIQMLEKQIADEEYTMIRNEIMTLQKILAKVETYADPLKRMQIITEFFHHIISRSNIFHKLIQIDEPFRTSLACKIAQLRKQGNYFQEQYINVMNRSTPFIRAPSFTPSLDDQTYYKELVVSFAVLQHYMFAVEKGFL